MQRIIRAKDAADSIGGIVTCVIRNLPSGLGEPVFDKFEAKLAHAMLSIPATKGFEIGSGFRGTEVPGSKHNDAFVRRPNGSLGTQTNWSGGVQGGITNSEDVYFRCVTYHEPSTPDFLILSSRGWQGGVQAAGNDFAGAGDGAV